MISSLLRNIFILSFLSFNGIYHAQDSENVFVLDNSRPYAYVEFDHVGPRKPLYQWEPNVGIWIRIVNNCRIPLRFMKFSGDQSDLVFDEVVPYKEGGLIITAESAEVELIAPKILVDGRIAPPPETQKEKERRPNQITPPPGYSDDLISYVHIAPGKSILVNFPRDHVSKDWFMRLWFTLAIGRIEKIAQPNTCLEFHEENIPPQFRQMNPRSNTGVQ